MPRGRPRQPICPTCKIRPKAPKQSYCSECTRLRARKAPRIDLDTDREPMAAAGHPAPVPVGAREASVGEPISTF